MERKEILEKVGNKKPIIGEMEKVKINKSCWIGNIVAVVLAVSLMITEGIFGHRSSIYAIASICFTWASVFYFCQYFIAKRPKAVLIGGILEGLGAIIFITLYCLTVCGVIV